jgi:hypothetical protein
MLGAADGEEIVEIAILGELDASLEGFVIRLYFGLR